MSYAIARRAFLRGAVGFAALLRSLESSAQGLTPKRFVVVHRPNGTIRSNYLPSGSGPGATLGPILQPFAEVMSSTLVVDGLQLLPGGGQGTHEAGIVTLYTGFPIGPPRPTLGPADDWLNQAASVDQVLATRSPSLNVAPYRSIQLGAHRDQSVPETADRVLSYAGPNEPMEAEISPAAAYARIFGSLASGTDPATLARARAKKQSVLDFVKGDLTRLRGLVPSSERPRLDTHETAIRDLERALDQRVAAASTSCPAPTGSWLSAPAADFNDVGAIASQMFAIMKAAFVCDLTRVVTFLWSPAVSDLQFEGLYPGMPRVAHHSLTHMDLTDPSIYQPLTAIDTWYAAGTANLIKDLKATPDSSGGSLLDNTIVLYANEVADGHHSLTNMPLVLFGGCNLGLRTGRIVNCGDPTNNRSVNDLWLTLAARLGVPLDSLGAPNQYAGPLSGLFHDHVMPGACSEQRVQPATPHR
jgi:hypothetical protein